MKGAQLESPIARFVETKIEGVHEIDLGFDLRQEIVCGSGEERVSSHNLAKMRQALPKSQYKMV
jgi:hypothetical protein